MNEKQLSEWASQPRPELSEAVAADVRDHVAALPSRECIYGYAILPGDPSQSADGIGPVAVVYNRADEIAVDPEASNFTYYKYSVDEWQQWELNKFSRTDALLASLNARFLSAHVQDAESYERDETTGTYQRSLLSAILDGFALAKARGVFGPGIEYLIMWISDSNDPIMEASARRLNSPSVVEEFLREFCG